MGDAPKVCSMPQFQGQPVVSDYIVVAIIQAFWPKAQGLVPVGISWYGFFTIPVHTCILFARLNPGLHLFASRRRLHRRF